MDLNYVNLIYVYVTNTPGACWIINIVMFIDRIHDDSIRIDDYTIILVSLIIH